MQEIGTWTSPSGREIRVWLKVVVNINVDRIDPAERGWFLDTVVPEANRLAQAELHRYQVSLATAILRWWEPGEEPA